MGLHCYPDNTKLQARKNLDCGVNTDLGIERIHLDESVQVRAYSHSDRQAIPEGEQGVISDNHTRHHLLDVLV